MKLKCLFCERIGLEESEFELSCRSCSHSFPVVGGIPRFVSRELYTESFGFQWRRFARTQLDSANGTTRSREAFIEKTGEPIADLRGKVVLDAGCGMGRFAEVCADAGAEVHAVDLSGAVEAAVDNLRDRSNVRVYQADIMNLPFPPQSFDFIYSIGVLHHTPDTKRAFSQLVPLLKPGGVIAVWLYSKRLDTMLGGRVLRLATPRLPKGALLRLSKIAIPLYAVHRVPLLGKLTLRLLPTSLDRNAEWRWLDTFDWYSPRYQSKHRYQEVEGWFRQMRLTQIRRGSAPISVRGKAPTAWS